MTQEQYMPEYASFETSSPIESDTLILGGASESYPFTVIPGTEWIYTQMWFDTPEAWSGYSIEDSLGNPVTAATQLTIDPAGEEFNLIIDPSAWSIVGRYTGRIYIRSFDSIAAPFPAADPNAETVLWKYVVLYALS